MVGVFKSYFLRDSILGQRLKLIIYPLIIYLAGVTAYTVYRYKMELKEKLKEIDHRLLIGAKQIKFILPEGFTSRCKTKESITREEHLRNMKRLNEFVKSGRYEYFYTIHMIDGEMCYSSTSYGQEDNPEAEENAYAYPLNKSGESHYNLIRTIFDSEEPKFFNNVDQWGKHRSCMVRQLAADGTYFLAGADYETSYIEHELWREVPTSIITALFFFLMATPFMYFINRYWIQTSDKLKELNSQLQEDVDFRKKVEKDLIKAKGKAEIAVETQKAFLANISHEIRTPMNGILGMSELLKRSALSEQQQENLKVIDKSSNHLLKIIEDLLNYSRLDAKDIELKINELAPQEIAECCFDLLGEQANARHVKLELVLNTRQSVFSDETRLNQVMINLLSNAIKFSKDAKVTVEINKLEGSSHSGIEVRVTDQGVGINKKDHSQIFEPFVQVDNSSTREFPGAGLGLAITKKLCEKLGGGIHVESEEGKGSTFIFTVFDKKKDDA